MLVVNLFFRLRFEGGFFFFLRETVRCPLGVVHTVTTCQGGAVTCPRLLFA